jgi:hypothetical protein
MLACRRVPWRPPFLFEFKVRVSLSVPSRRPFSHAESGSMWKGSFLRLKPSPIRASREECAHGYYLL